jgi:hypothetical protein
MEKHASTAWKIVFGVLLVIFVFLVVLFTSEFLTVKSHRDYFKQPIAQQTVQQWMTFRSVQNHYHVNVDGVLHKTLSFSDMVKPISGYCIRENLDCNQLVSTLEADKELNFNANHG